MDPDIFMRVLTGLSYQDFRKADVYGLQNIGKLRESKQVQLVYKSDGDKYPKYANKETLVEYLKEFGGEEGWILDPYLGSQGSVVRQEDQTILNYRLYRYLDASSS